MNKGRSSRIPFGVEVVQDLGDEARTDGHGSLADRLLGDRAESDVRSPSRRKNSRGGGR